MRAILLTAMICALAGCQPTAAPTDPVATSEPTETTQTAGGGESIAPMTTAPIATAPISGAESVQGGGSGVGTVAKDRAKAAAGRASQSSLGAGGDSD